MTEPLKRRLRAERQRAGLSLARLAEVPPSLRVFADQESLSPREFEQLASIRWRRGETPSTPERWQFILNSLRASRQFDNS